MIPAPVLYPLAMLGAWVLLATGFGWFLTWYQREHGGL